MGKGELDSTPHKQKLNTNISTETELVATNDVMPQLFWTRYVLEAHGVTCQGI